MHECVPRHIHLFHLICLFGFFSHPVTNQDIAVEAGAIELGVDIIKRKSGNMSSCSRVCMALCPLLMKCKDKKSNQLFPSFKPFPHPSIPSFFLLLIPFHSFTHSPSLFHPFLIIASYSLFFFPSFFLLFPPELAVENKKRAGKAGLVDVLMEFLKRKPLDYDIYANILETLGLLLADGKYR